MKKYIIYSMTVAFALSAMFIACKNGNGNGVVPGTDTEEGVVINGVRWATRNVDKPGTFAANPEDAGMFYQWNRKIGWSSTDPMINSNGSTTWNDSYAEDTWKKANDPSPAGWRIPTAEELQSLTDTDYVTWVWTTENGVNGYRCTDKATGASLFLPAAGSRYVSGGTLLHTGTDGDYWSSTPAGSMVCSLMFASVYFYVGNDVRTFGHNVRCVADE
ncbi:MAG: fibrobacter succinogenes major paralogous domain-containing protein [Bacteroidales bacterium]|nr:fibrobacter succinogenes major paralogous domain-containing protein [Bacteroidales bacterium]